MKSIFTLTILLLTSFFSFGQTSFEWVTTDSMVVKLELDVDVPLKLDITNLTNDTLKLAAEVVQKDIPEGWDGMVCLEGICLGLIPDVGEINEMIPIVGDQKGFVRLTINPMKGEEFGSLRIRMYNIDDPSDDDTATWLLNDISLSVKDYSLMNTMTIFPNPVVNSFQILTDNQIDKVSLFDISGKSVYNNTFNSFTDSKIDVSAIPSGIYFVHTYFQGTINGRKKIIIE